MANTAAQFVVDTYQQDLGGPPKPENLIYWASKIQSGEMTEAEVKAAIQGSAEGIAYAQNQTPSQERAEYAASLEQGDGTVNTAVQATEADIRSAYTELLGGPPKPEALEYWLSQGLTPAKLKESIAASPEGQQYATTQKVSPERQAYMDSLAAGNDGGQPPNTANFNPLIQQYYQELFNRQAQQPGLDYFSGRLSSGDLTEDALRDAIIAGAQGTDRMYYDASQSGGPVFDATQALFGRRPARGAFNPETGQLEGGFGQYRSQLDAGNLTPEQLRGRLVQLAYNRGEGGGQSGDYQNYLNTLGIDRSGNPFLQDGGTYANVRYGSDLSQYQPNPGMPPPPPGGDTTFPPGGDFPFPPGGGGMPPMSPGKGGRIPGQYITGNQLYSGLPYGMTQPMGMMNFMQPMMQPTIYQPPQMSQQYMPNRGLMSGYSTGFGPYGGYQRPRFGGGKGGRMRPMGGGKGGFGGGFGY